MIRKILSLPTLALCFTLGSALFAGCNEEEYIKDTKVRWSNVKNPEYGDPINITLKAEGETFTTMGDYPWISFRSYASTLDTFTSHSFSEADKDTAYYKDIVIYLTRNKRERTTTLKLVAPPNRTQQPKQFDFSIGVTPLGTYIFKVRQPALPAKAQ
jgi:lipoprotein